MNVTSRLGYILCHNQVLPVLYVVSKPAVFSTRVASGCGFTREKIRLGTNYIFSWHRGMPKIFWVGMVTLGSSTHGVLALLHYAYRAVARDVTINKIYFRVAKYEQKRHNSQAHYVAKTSNRLL